MSDQCPNCGQSVLTTDSVCWHCGWKLPKQSGSKKQPIEQNREEAASQPFSFKGFAGYGLTTGLIILAAFWVIAALGRQPRVIISEQTDLKPGWTAVTDQRVRFTLNLPENWDFQEPDESQKIPPLAERIESSPLLRAAISPYGRFGGNLSLRLAAADGSFLEDPLESFLIIVEDTRENQLSLNEVTDLMENSTPGLALLREEVGESLRGEPQINFLIRVVGGSPEVSLLRCQQRFIRADQTGFILTACTLPAGYSALSTDLHDILASFQLLSG